jgi:hypothetical protein
MGKKILVSNNQDLETTQPIPTPLAQEVVIEQATEPEAAAAMQEAWDDFYGEDCQVCCEPEQPFHSFYSFFSSYQQAVQPIKLGAIILYDILSIVLLGVGLGFLLTGQVLPAVVCFVGAKFLS